MSELTKRLESAFRPGSEWVIKAIQTPRKPSQEGSQTNFMTTEQDRIKDIWNRIKIQDTEVLTALGAMDSACKQAYNNVIRVLNEDIKPLEF